MNLELRRATLNDAAVLAAVIQTSFAEYTGRLEPPTGALSETPDTVAQTLEAAGAFLVEADGLPAGCVFFKPEQDDLYLFRLAVLPDHRGRGIGARLIRAVEEEAQRMGLRKVRLQTRVILDENIAYYERLGYVRGEDIPYPGTDLPFRAELVKQLL